MSVFSFSLVIGPDESSMWVISAGPLPSEGTFPIIGEALANSFG